MWNHIINIHSSELLSTKTKKSRINESLKKKKSASQKKKKKQGTIYILNLIIILQFFFQELTKYKNVYQ